MPKRYWVGAPFFVSFFLIKVVFYLLCFVFTSLMTHQYAKLTLLWLCCKWHIISKFLFCECLQVTIWKVINTWKKLYMFNYFSGKLHFWSCVLLRFQLCSLCFLQQFWSLCFALISSLFNLVKTIHLFFLYKLLGDWRTTLQTF